MYRKFDVTGNLLFAHYFFFEEVNTAMVALMYMFCGGCMCIDNENDRLS
jgi:hypothetical protein